MLMKKISKRQSRKNVLSGLLVTFLVFFSINLVLIGLGTEKQEITVESITYYLDDCDLVFSIELQSTFSSPVATFTFNATDEQVSVTESEHLHWKINNISKELTYMTITILEFRLFINDTSDIPAIYSLSVQSDQVIKNFVIKPFSRIEKSAGGGASGGDWIISDYQVLDPTIQKGDEVEMRTLLINWESTSVGPVYLDYEFYYNYYGFDNIKSHTGNGHPTGQYIPRGYGEDNPGVKSIDVDITWRFDNDDGWFAFNTGAFWAEKAYAYVSGYSTKTRTSTEESVTVSNLNDKIFAVVYYDTEFTSLSWVSSVTSFFSSAVSHKMKVNNDNDVTEDTLNGGLEELMNVDYLIQPRSGWNPSSGYSFAQMLNHLYQTHAENDLGLSSDWDRTGDGGTLTSYDNHGFDLLLGFTGTGSDAGGAVWDVPGNLLVVCARDTGIWDHKLAELVLVHEMSHNFGAHDPDPPTYPDPPIHCVMDGGEQHNLYSSGWFVHWTGNVDQMTSSFK